MGFNKAVSAKKFRSRDRYGPFYAIPAILGFMIFSLIPMITSFYLSLTNYRLADFNYKFIGFQNFITSFTGENIYFYPSIIATLKYVVLVIPLTVVCSFLAAMLLNQKIKLLSFFRTVFYLPNILPLVATSLIWLWLYQPNIGIINSVFRLVGIEGPRWLFDKFWVTVALAIINVWASGNLIIIFLAGLQDCPRQLYEAVSIDGGNAFHRFVHVTFPFMTPIIFFNLVMQSIVAFQIFAQVIIMTGGGPDNASLVLNFLIYREAFVNHNMGYACSLAVILFLFVMTLTAVYFSTASKWVFYPDRDEKRRRTKI